MGTALSCPRGYRHLRRAVCVSMKYRFVFRFDRLDVFGGGRVSTVNFAEKHVKELKPNNPRAIKQGQKQVEGYRQELQAEHGGNWTSSVETYSK